MLIQIARTVRLTLQDAEVQALHPGELYEVAPAVGSVLVTDGWAREVLAQSTVAWSGARRGGLGGGWSGGWSSASTAHDDPCDDISTS